MVLTDEQHHDLDFTYNTLSWNIIQGRLEGDDTKRPDLPNFRDYFDSKQTVPYEALVEHMKQANKLLMVVLGKQRDGKYTLTCWDIDTKDENIRRLFLHYYPSSLWQETRDGYHFFFGIQGDPDEVRRYFESKDLLGKQYSITDDIKVEVYTANRAIAFIGERYGKLQGNLEFLKKEDFCDAKVAFIHALHLYAYLKDYYKPDYRDKIVFRLSGILAKKRIPKHIGLNIIDGLASIFNDEERKSRLKVTEDSYKDYADGKPLNTKLEEVIPKDVAKKIYEYFDYKPNGNGKKEKVDKEKEKGKGKEKKEKESLLFKLFSDNLNVLEHNSKVLNANTITEVMDYEIKKIPLQLYTLIGKNTHLHYVDKLFESIYMDTVFTRHIKYNLNDKNFYYFVGNHYKIFDDEDTLLQLLHKYAVGYINRAMLKYYELKMKEIELMKPELEAKVEAETEEGKLLQIHEQLQQDVYVEDNEDDEGDGNDENEELRKVRSQLRLLQEIFDCYMSYIFDRSRLKKVLDILRVHCSYNKNNDIHKDEYGHIIPFEDCYVYAKIDKGVPILKLIEPSPDYFIKFVFPIRIKGKFNPDYSNVNINFIKSTKLWRFMVDIANDDEELAFAMLTIFSSCLIIHKKKRFFYILKGSGNNGKSTLIKLLEYALEPIFGYIPVNALLVKDPKNAEETPRPFYLNMIDKRIVVTNELKEQGNLDSNIIKQTTGGDSIPVRNLFDRKVTYIEPNFTLFMTTNPMPKINDKSLAMRDRLIVIEFNRRFEGEEVDKYMLEKLLENVEEIYLVLLEMLKVHLTRDVENVVKGCKAIMDTTKRYWYEQDGVQWYLDEYAIDTKDKDNDILYVNEIEDKIEIFYREILKKDPPSRDTIRRLLRLKLPDDRFDYDIKKHRSLILRGYRLRPFTTDQKNIDSDDDNNNNMNNTVNAGSNNDDNSIVNNNNNNNNNNNDNNNNSDNNNNTDNTNTDNNNNNNDNDRATLDKILFALFNPEDGGYLRCPICNDNIRYTSPYAFSKHVCYIHNREYGSFDVNGITAVRIQDFIRLLQMYYPVTEEYDHFYYIRRLSKEAQKQNDNNTALDERSPA